MEITLVHPYPDPACYGLRLLRSLLRREGHRVHLVNLPDYTGDGHTLPVRAPRRRYSRRLLDDLCEVASRSQLIGLSVMTNYWASACEISGALRRELPDIPIVWGGAHPTIRPDECLDHATAAVVGEAEHSLIAFARAIEAGEEWRNTRGLVFRHGDRTVRNPLPPLVQDLDSLPAPDVDAVDHWTSWQGRIRPVDDDRFCAMLSRTTVSAHYGKAGYQTMTSRGCPHRCSYCANSTIRAMYPGESYVRFRSVDSVLGECEQVVARYPFVNYIWFSDDVFFSRPLAQLQRFAEQYASRIGLPFYLLGSPATLTAEKYRLMLDAGLHTIQMGIESGSDEILELFNRRTMGCSEVMRAAGVLASHAERTQTPYYDLIVHTPWETDDHRRETLRFIARLPRPFRIQLFSLVLWPGTDAYERACREGLVEDEGHEIYDHMYTLRDGGYLSLVLAMAATGRLPAWLVDLLADERMDALVHNPVSRLGGRAVALGHHALRAWQTTSHVYRRLEW